MRSPLTPDFPTQGFCKMIILCSSPLSSPEAKIGTTGALIILFQLLVATTLGGAPVALPGCPDICGNISIPYPFGIGHGCFHSEGFNLTCDETRQPPKLFLDHNVQVLDISLLEGTVRINSKIPNVISLEFNGSWSGPMAYHQILYVSAKHNRFVAMGCNFLAHLIANGGAHDGQYISICAAMCVPRDYWGFRDPSCSGLGCGGFVSDTSCTGLGCCQTPISRGFLYSYGVQLKDLSQANSTLRFGTAFVVDQEWFSSNGAPLQLDFFSSDTQKMAGSTAIPTVMEWVAFDSTDKMCISVNSEIVNGDRVLCNCSKGYEGNPYFINGCQDIDECQQPDVYPCHGTCINVPGTYRCSSKKSITSLPGLITILAVGSGFGLLFSLLGVHKISNKIKRRRAKKLRMKFFKKNHGLLLQQLISSNKDIAERMKIFSLQELEQATNKFDQNRILGGGGHGTVYKGILSDQRVVAIKKSKIAVQREIDQFINEVVILSQINHRHVVKLFGCCLETEVPLLVYEFISNGTLSDHLHAQREDPFSWKDRLRIALETASAIAYLHFAASISVFHRDIKSANILLTDSLTSKVSDFGASRSIAIDETGILTAIQGTYGYLDPEYYYTSRLTEKSDVYSFGVILAELLTRVRPVFSSQSSEGTSLSAYFISKVRDNCLLDILDPLIVEEGGAEQAEVVARLAEACLSLKGEERPTMRQVEMRLEDVKGSKTHLISQVVSDAEVTQNVLKHQSCKGSQGGEGTRLHSLEKEFLASSEFPR